MLKFLFTLLTLCLPFVAFCQDPSLRIERINYTNYCTGNELGIDVSVSGVFNADNKFSVIVRANGMVWEYPAELNANRLVTNLKDARLATYERLYLTVVSSSPRKETEFSSSFRVLSKTSLRLALKSDGEIDTLNSSDPVEFKVIATPGGPGQFTMSNGEKFDLGYGGYAQSVSNFKMPKTETGTFTITEASNVCGPMLFTGELKVKVNPVDIMPVNVSPFIICEGSEFKIVFNAAKGDFTANTKYRIRLFAHDLVPNRPAFIDVPANLTAESTLSARFPTGFNLLSSRLFYAGIVTENPSTVSKNTAFKLFVYPKPSVSLTASSTSINIGEEVYLDTNPIGMYPFSSTLKDTEMVPTTRFYLRPDKTTQHQIQTFSSGCGIIENPPHKPVTITVKPSLFLGNPLASTSHYFCEGKTVRIAFRAAGVNAATTYSIESSAATGEKFVFPAKVIGDSIEFFIPKRATRESPKGYEGLGYVRLVSSNPALVSPVSHIVIRSEPYILVAPNSVTSVPFPSALRSDYLMYGGGPFELELANGTTTTYDYYNIWFNHYITKDTIFKVASLSNACFKNSDIPAFPLKVLSTTDPTPNLFIKVLKNEFCMSDSVEVDIFFNGKFQEGNEFTLSYLANSQVTTYTIDKITRSGRYKIKLPDNRGRYDASVMLSSTLPRLTSETERFYMIQKPNAPYISNSGTKTEPFRYLKSSGLYLNISTYANAFIHYSVNDKAATGTADNSGQFYVKTDFAANQLSEFKIHSVANSCGVNSEERSSWYYPLGYSINLLNYDIPNRFCFGMPYEINFYITNGQAAASTQFFLQIGQGSTPTFTDFATSTDSKKFSFKIPDLPQGNYVFRVRSSDNFYSENSYISIAHPPTAIFQLSSGSLKDSVVHVNYGDPIHLKTFLTGSDPWSVSYNNHEQRIITNQPGNYSPIITQSQTFSISKVRNSCGFGTSTGRVSVRVKPVLKFTTTPENPATALCGGQILQMDYQLDGTELSASDYIVFTLTGQNQQVIKLDSVKTLKGRVQLKVPANLTGTYFLLQASLSSYQISKSVSFQLFTSPDLTLMGDNVIRSGESAKLFIKANNSFAANTRFELSDGTFFEHPLPYAGQVAEIFVKPGQTTTYTLKEIKSSCGAGKASGSATITVETRKSEWLSIQAIEPIRKSYLCNSDTLSIRFLHYYGTSQTAGNYVLMLSDSLGKNMTAIPTLGSISPIRAIIPSSVKASDFYRIRLISSDQRVSGSTYEDRVKLREYATAQILTPEILYQKDQPAQVVVKLQGTAPFFYHYGNNQLVNSRSSSKYQDTIRINPISTLAEYKLMDVSNSCGNGRIADPSTFRIELITANEPIRSDEVRFGPNPVTKQLDIWFGNRGKRTLRLLSESGLLMHTSASNDDATVIDMQRFTLGIYLLQVKYKQKTTTYRIFKN